MPRGSHTKLTDKAVETLSRPKQGRRDKYDSLAPGLHVRVSERGRKQWCLVGRMAGEARQRRYHLGEFPHMGVEEARLAAQAYRAKLRAGIDPRDELLRSLEDRKALLLDSQLESYFKAQVRSLRSGAEVERVFRRDVLPTWQGRSVREISKADVARLVRSIATGEGRKIQGEKGPFEPAPLMANRTLAYIRAFFRWLVSQNEIVADPTEGLKGATKEKSRERKLTDDELAEVWHAAEGLGYPFGAFVRALILTGQRRSEVAEMRWSEVDLDRAVWVLPASRMKGDVEHRVPLSQSMLDLLVAVPRHKKCDFVFAGEPRRAKGAKGEAATVRPAIAGFSDGKERLDTAIHAARIEADPGAEAMPSWRLHDLRRTFSTGCAKLRIPQEVTEAAIAHRSGKQSGVAGVYNVYEYEDEKRTAMETWARHVMSILGRAESNVVALEARG